MLRLCFVIVLFSSYAFGGTVQENQKQQAQILAKGPFMMGMYAVNNNDASMLEAKQAGMDYVHNYVIFDGFGNPKPHHPHDPAVQKDYMDRAYRHGLKVMASISRTHLYQGRFDEIQKFIDRTKDHPALYAWYLIDEPGTRKLPRKNFHKVYEMCKAATPDTPVIVAEQWCKNWKEATAYCDILALDHYRVRGEPFPKSRLVHTTDFTQLGIDSGTPTLPILQSFPHITPEMKADGREPRFPNPTELRYQLYTSLAQGVGGVLWFSQSHARRFDPQWLRRDFAPFAQQAKYLISMMPPIPSVQRIKEGNAEKNVYIGYWPQGDSGWLIMTHSSQNTKAIRIALGKELSNVILHPWGPTPGGAINVNSNGRFMLTAGPWATFVYRVQRSQK